jgi:hypothetical protein
VSQDPEHTPGLPGLVEPVPLGEGATGVVWSATDPALQREVAVKVLARRHGGAAVEAKLLTEARITGQLDHPGVVPVHGLVTTAEGLPGYVMKRVRGVTLQEWLDGRGREVDAGTRSDDADLAGRLERFLKLADTVHFAHTRGVVHRDLKPENVMVGEHGEVWLMDWGLASSTDGAAPKGIEGTPGFLAPEQANGAAPTPAMDQYALGLILQELVTLRPAVAGRTALERALANSMGERVPLRRRDGGRVPRELVGVIERATAVDPRARYADVGDFAADVRRYLAGEPVQARPDSALQAAARWMGRHRERTLVVVVVLFTLGTLLLTASELRASRQQEEARRHEARVATRVAAVAARAGLLDARLSRDEGLLRAIAGITAERLARPPADGQTPWFADEPATAPLDLAPHPAWRQAVSLSTVAFTGPPGVDRDVAHALVGLGPVLREAAAQSAGGAAFDVLPPVAWVSVGLVGGVSASWPGHAGFAAGYDGRKRPWYTVAVDAPGPVWGAPYLDSSGLGVLLPCSTPIRDPASGALLGVASVKLSLDRLIGDLLAWDGADGFLVDREGRVIVSSADRGNGVDAHELRNEALPLLPFDDPEVAGAVREGRPMARDDGRTAVVAHPLGLLGGAYVVRGPRDRW